MNTDTQGLFEDLLCSDHFEVDITTVIDIIFE